MNTASKAIGSVLVAVTAFSLAWAGPPGENTNGSTTTTLTLEVHDFDRCATRAVALAASSSTSADADADARTFARAAGHVRLLAKGDATLDLTRDGLYGSVFQTQLTAAMGASQYYVVNSLASASSEADADADASVEVQLTVQRIVDALAGVDVSLSFDLDPIPISGSVSAGAAADAIAEGKAEAAASAAGSATAEGGGSGSAQASVEGTTTAGSHSSIYVQGANIEEFEGDLSFRTGSLTDVKTAALERAYTRAYVLAAARAMARAAVKAKAEAGLSFCYDLPLIGSDCLPLTDDDMAAGAASAIARARDRILAQARSAAKSVSEMLIRSRVRMGVRAAFENLPGIVDKLELVGGASGHLACKDVASASAASSASTSP